MNDEEELDWTLQEMNKWRDECIQLLKKYPCLEKWLVEIGCVSEIEELKHSKILSLKTADKIFYTCQKSPYSTQINEEEARLRYEEEKRKGIYWIIERLRQEFKVDCKKYRIQLLEHLHVINEWGEEQDDVWSEVKENKDPIKNTLKSP